MYARRRQHGFDRHHLYLRHRARGHRPTIYGADTLELYAIDRALVSALVSRLERRVACSVSITDRELYVSIGSDQLTGRVVRLRRDG